MPTSKVLRTTVFLLFLTALAVGPTLAGETQQTATTTAAPASPFLADCGLEIELPGQAAQGEMCPAVQPEPELLAKPIRRGYCRCGCGSRCTTDADCGPGGNCVGFISCC